MNSAMLAAGCCRGVPHQRMGVTLRDGVVQAGEHRRALAAVARQFEHAQAGLATRPFHDRCVAAIRAAVDHDEHGPPMPRVPRRRW